MKADKRTASQLLVEQLRANGVDRIFCVPGESFLHVLDALLAFPEIDVVPCRHESGAAMMAEAYGKLTGRPGVAFVTRGPGATNASAGVHVAHQDSTPLVLFIGHVERTALERDAFQEIDYKSMFSSFSKAVTCVMDARRLPEVVSRAFTLAVSGRPGPVVIALPEDILSEPLDTRAAPASARLRSAPSPRDIDTAAAAISASRRPTVVVGGGGWTAAAAEGMAAFAAAWELPVVTSFRCQDYVDNAHPCYAGNLGLGANPALTAALTESDLILAVGARLGDVSTNGYSLLDIPEPEPALYHIHPEPRELGRIYRPTLGLVSDSAAAVTALREMAPPAARPWRERTAAMRQAYLQWTEPPPVPGALQMGQIMIYLRETLPADAIVANGAGNFAIWPNRYHRYRSYRSMLAPTSGSMGYGIPAAVAAKILHPERTVVAFAGDGDFMMTGQELATAMRQGAAIIVLLINNGMYGTIRMHQEREFPGRVSATTLTNPDFMQLARSYGAFAARITRTADFAPAFEAALASGGIAVIEMVSDPDMLSPTDTISSLRQGDVRMPATAVAREDIAAQSV